MAPDQEKERERASFEILTLAPPPSPSVGSHVPGKELRARPCVTSARDLSQSGILRPSTVPAEGSLF